VSTVGHGGSDVFSDKPLKLLLCKDLQEDYSRRKEASQDIGVANPGLTRLLISVKLILMSQPVTNEGGIDHPFQKLELAHKTGLT
jgi:hypothetical protein